MRILLKNALLFIKNKQLILISFILLLFSNSVLADSPLLFDAVNRSGIPRNFRTMEFLCPNHGAKAIGSAQFSEKELRSVIARVKTPLVIVDLRQESHGYLNGHAISWGSAYNWGNINKTSQAIELEQSHQLHTLSQPKKAPIHFSLSMSEKGTLNLAPYNLSVHKVFSEAELAKKYHVGYFRLYIADNHSPTETEVNRFVKFVRTLPANTTLYFHCRAGRGRTTTLMAMYDMMHNANSVSFNEILRRQFLIGGKDLLKLPDPESYKYPLAAERIKFLQKFYQSCISQKNVRCTESCGH